MNSWLKLICALAIVAAAACSATPTGDATAKSADAKSSADGANAGDAAGAQDGACVGTACADSANAGADGNPAAQDGTVAADASGDAAGDAMTVDSAAADVQVADIAPEDSGPDIDYDLLDPADTGVPEDTGPPPQMPGVLYAHTADTLYKLDKAGFVQVGNFLYNKNAGQMTDIAIDKDGKLFGVTFYDLFECDPKTAACNWLASLPSQFNGLTFVPVGTVKATEEALIGIENSGGWNLIEVQGASATIKKLGSYGAYQSSGDAFSLEKVGTYATVKAGMFGGNDKLAEVDAKTGKVTKIVGDTGVTDLWGFAWFNQVFYGFASNGGVYSVDVTNGKATKATGFSVPNGVSWWGAGVSTRAALGK